MDSEPLNYKVVLIGESGKIQFYIRSWENKHNFKICEREI